MREFLGLSHCVLVVILAGILQIDTKTLYNWRKNKPELYTIVLLGFKFKEILKAQREICDKLERIEKELNERLRM